MRRRGVDGVRCGTRTGGPAPLPRQETLHRAADAVSGEHRTQGRDHHGRCQVARPRDRHCRDGIRVHGRIDGIRRRREDRAFCRTGSHARSTAHRRFMLRGRAHAGRRAVADADGQDLRRPGAPASGRDPVHLVADRSHDRRRDGVIRDAGRREHRRAASLDRLRWAAGHRADDPRETARGFPAQRVPVGARHARHGGAAQRVESDDG